VADEERPTGPQQPGDAHRPGGEVGEPGDGPDAREDDVELAVQRVGRVLGVRLDERRLEPAAVGEVTGDREAARGDVDAGDPGAEPREGEGVGADVALEVEDVEAVDAAPGKVRSQEGDVLAGDAADPGRVGDEAGE